MASTELLIDLTEREWQASGRETPPDGRDFRRKATIPLRLTATPGRLQPTVESTKR